MSKKNNAYKFKGWRERGYKIITETEYVSRGAEHDKGYKKKERGKSEHVKNHDYKNHASGDKQRYHKKMKGLNKNYNVEFGNKGHGFGYKQPKHYHYNYKQKTSYQPKEHHQPNDYDHHKGIDEHKVHEYQHSQDYHIPNGHNPQHPHHNYNQQQQDDQQLIKDYQQLKHEYQDQTTPNSYKGDAYHQGNEVHQLEPPEDSATAPSNTKNGAPKNDQTTEQVIQTTSELTNGYQTPEDVELQTKHNKYNYNIDQRNREVFRNYGQRMNIPSNSISIEHEPNPITEYQSTEFSGPFTTENNGIISTETSVSNLGAPVTDYSSYSTLPLTTESHDGSVEEVTDQNRGQSINFNNELPPSSHLHQQDADFDTDYLHQLNNNNYQFAESEIFQDDKLKNDFYDHFDQIPDPPIRQEIIEYEPVIYGSNFAELNMRELNKKPKSLPQNKTAIASSNQNEISLKKLPNDRYSNELVRHQFYNHLESIGLSKPNKTKTNNKNHSQENHRKKLKQILPAINPDASIAINIEEPPNLATDSPWDQPPSKKVYEKKKVQFPRLKLKKVKIHHLNKNVAPTIMHPPPEVSPTIIIQPTQPIKVVDPPRFSSMSRPVVTPTKTFLIPENQKQNSRNSRIHFGLPSTAFQTFVPNPMDPYPPPASSMFRIQNILSTKIPYLAMQPTQMAHYKSSNVPSIELKDDFSASRLMPTIIFNAQNRNNNNGNNNQNHNLFKMTNSHGLFSKFNARNKMNTKAKRFLRSTWASLVPSAFKLNNPFHRLYNELSMRQKRQDQLSSLNTF